MKVAINGFGRIGKAVLKIGLEKGLNIVAINDLQDVETLVYLLKYDSVYGPYNKKISFGRGYISIGGKKIRVFSEKDPSAIPWQSLGIDVVIDASGACRERDSACKHFITGTKKVIVSAPMKQPDITIVPGVNDKKLKKSHKVISVASCTTNCLAPIVKVLDDKYGIRKGFMTTVHAYTTSQRLLDGSHKKLRRGRAAAQNIVPTTSGATTAVTEVLPHLKGKLDGLALRVPVMCGSITDFVCELKKATTADQVNTLLRKASQGNMKGILAYSDEELVSSDIVGNPHSSIVDGLSTQVTGNMVKVLSWYDNEYGYSNRLVDVVRMMKRM